MTSVRGPQPVDLLVVDCHLASAVRVVQEVAAVAPGLQIIFLADGELQRGLRKQIFPVGRIGNNWEVVDPTDDGAVRRMAEGAALTQRRRLLRTTLTAYNSRREAEIPSLDRTGRLAASPHFLASILAQARDAILATDLTGLIIAANEAAERLWRRERGELFQKRLWEDVDEPNRHFLRQGVETLALQPEPARAELELLRPDGTRIPVEVTLGPVRDDTGRCIACSVILRDISERKEAEASAARQAAELRTLHDAAVAAARAKDDFLAALSHELRNPLNPVLLIASDAAGDESYPPGAREAFETIYKNVELEARLIDDLLDLTRIARGKVNLDLRPHDFHSLIRDALAMIDAELAGKLVKTRIELCPGVPMILADTVRMQQVLWNVLKNAVKFTPERGTITVRSRILDAEQRVQLAITDTGIGMTRSEMERVFDAFAQGEHAEKGSHRFGGLGLGLSISRSLVELHHGTIRADSPGRDLGSTFTIEFPLQRLEPAPQGIDGAGHGVGPATPQGTVLVSILLVEDHAATRLALERLLTRRNYHVCMAASVEEALDLLARESVQLLISDIGLPDGTGYEIMAAARRKNGAVKGIALTGYGTEEDVQKSQAAGFALHLTKPVTIQALNHALATVGT
jgi:PAS domain S-box-containing protein